MPCGSLELFSSSGKVVSYLEINVKQVDVLPSKNQALCDLIYNVIING